MKKFNENEGIWRTIMGRRVFIRKGENLSEAMKKSNKFRKRSPEDLDRTEDRKQAIIKRHADKIRKNQGKRYPNSEDDIRKMAKTNAYDDIAKETVPELKDRKNYKMYSELRHHTGKPYDSVISGYSEAVKKGNVKDYLMKHNFSESEADGFMSRYGSGKKESDVIYQKYKAWGKDPKDWELFAPTKEEGKNAYNRWWNAKSTEEYKASEKKAPRYSDADKNDPEFRKSALSEMRRYERNWSGMTRDERRKIAPGGINEIRSAIKELEQHSNVPTMEEFRNRTAKYYDENPGELKKDYETYLFTHHGIETEQSRINERNDRRAEREIASREASREQKVDLLRQRNEAVQKYGHNSKEFWDIQNRVNEMAKGLSEAEKRSMVQEANTVMSRTLDGNSDRPLEDFDLKGINDYNFKNMVIELLGYADMNATRLSKAWKEALKSGNALNFLKGKAGMTDAEIRKFKEKYKL